MSQQSFSDMEYSLRKRTTKREEFLEIMDEIIPWDELFQRQARSSAEGNRKNAADVSAAMLVHAVG